MTPISRGAQFYSIFNSNEVNSETKIYEYLLNQRSPITYFVKNLGDAIYSIVGINGSFKGNCFAIAPNLLLTCRHCLEGEIEIKGTSGPIEVVFDGSSYGIDFAILWLREGRFKPVILDLDIGIGDSIQMYRKLEGSSLNIYVRPFSSQSFNSPGGGSYAMRGDLASSQTSPGESGAPRMLLQNGYVHAMHQGNSEGLTMNAVYAILELGKDKGDRNADYILSKIKVTHSHTRYLNWSPLTIKSGDVEEEKPRVNGHVKFTDSVKKQVVVAKFHYTEIGEGKGNRWIKIHKEGVAGSQITYAISPNPHHNLAYNKKGQPKFYHTLTSVIGNDYLLNKVYPIQRIVKVFKENFTLTRDLG
ncbi:trypsin-like peptidase domain-containing protein [Candidatus Protochlamydia sp. W-9]|uniref:trypsin-like peptidase domain-containing protein n=1 Tax=Candidatus Protochlamydia sp. W-9 TaxID=1785087 RepID=UPI00096A486E|nr:trypsin-like peptidase domain-containing protein [Candidatus Protochlamydia sp. W-9]